jgi:hypothetical protein
MNAPFPFKPERTRRVFDTECAHGYWLLKFKAIDTGHVDSFALWPGSSPLDVARILQIIATSTIIGFNSLHYDIPMISLALTGADTVALKAANDAIIPGSGLQGLKSWQFYDRYGVEPPPGLDHIDIMEVAPGVRISLKTYMGCVHSQKMQDLPFDPAAVFTPFDRVETAVYCENDLQGTIDLYRAIEDRIQLREALNPQYQQFDRKFDARSKSDAQIAEAAFKAKLYPIRPEPRYVPHGYTFHYRAPEFIKFRSPELQAVLETVQSHAFVVNDKDQLAEEFEDAQGKKTKTGIVIPQAIKAIRYLRGVSTYKFGMGGLHSQEKAVSWYTIPGAYCIEDDDVESYYPKLILMMRMFPEAIGPEFIAIYQEIFDTRIHAKHMAKECKARGDKAGAKHWKTIADGLKIVLNGTFGKLGSKYSILFAPEQMIQVTLTGQLAMLMLIERLEDAAIPVISANTDGIVTRVPDGMQWLKNNIIAQWESETGLKTERTHYKAVHMQNVNSYIAFKDDGETKVKGFFAEPGVTNTLKVPARTICADAVVAYLREGTPISKTVRSSRDIRRFLTVRNVKGGAVKRSYSPFQKMMRGSDVEPFEDEPAITMYLGKVVRYVYGRGEETAIHYKTNNHKVPNSDGAVPVMELPAQFPEWIDYEKYEREAIEMLRDVGVSYAS